MLLCGGPTGGVVADGCLRAGPRLVVGEDGGEVGEATHAEKLAGGFGGVAGNLYPVVPLYESHVVLHQWHVVPHQRAVAGLWLLHPHVLRRTWDWQRKRDGGEQINGRHLLT